MTIALVPPVRPINKGEIKAASDALEDLRKKTGYGNFGFELVQVGADLNYVNKQRKNLEAVLGADYAKNYKISFGVPRTYKTRDGSRKFYNLLTEEGVDNLRQSMHAANKLGAEMINFHTFTVFTMNEYKPEYDDFQYKKRAIKKILRSVEEVVKEVEEEGVYVLPVIEHPTVPLFGEQEEHLRVEEALFNCTPNYFEEWKLVPNLAFDTCHCQSAIVAARELKKGTYDRKHGDGYYLLGSRYPQEQPNFLDAIKRLKNIRQVHIAGFGSRFSEKGNRWVPTKMGPDGKIKTSGEVFLEGTIPGDDIIGEDNYRGLTKEFMHKDIGFLFEIHTKDFRNPVETEEAMIRVATWINES